MCVCVSNKNIYVQLVDDVNSVTIANFTTLSKDHEQAKTVAAASSLGERAAKVIKDKGIESIVFDRSGFRYHGRIKAIADAVRQAGVSF